MPLILHDNLNGQQTQSLQRGSFTAKQTVGCQINTLNGLTVPVRRPHFLFTTAHTFSENTSPKTIPRLVCTSSFYTPLIATCPNREALLPMHSCQRRLADHPIFGDFLR
ncbi:hypothetical protein F2P79_007467 [Pimephales promelas]|nr:hypothetical protein F2P79_007467 [Pimephales promelas]